MSTKSTQKKKRKLKPPAKGIAEIYRVLAVLIVLIPEWMAEFSITILSINSEKELPKNNKRWEQLTELRLSTLNIRELRLLAM